MSETGDPSHQDTAVRVEDIERALVLAREVATATAGGGAANLLMDHLRALFANGDGPLPVARMQAALEAAGLRVDPPLADATDAVSLKLERGRAALGPKHSGKRAGPAPAGGEPARRPSGVAAYQAAAGTPPRPEADSGVSLDDARRTVAAEQAEQRTAGSIAALMPALIAPVLAASFLGPLFGASFAGLALLASALLSRPGALADGRLGPLNMPASLARSFLLVSFGVALGALMASLALAAAGGRDTKPADPNAPLDRSQPAPRTTPPAPPSAQQQQQEKKAAAERKAAADRRKRAERRREARARAGARAKAKARARARREREREREAQQNEAPPPSGGGAAPAPVP